MTDEELAQRVADLIRDLADWLHNVADLISDFDDD